MIALRYAVNTREIKSARGRTRWNTRLPVMRISDTDDPTSPVHSLVVESEDHFAVDAQMMTTTENFWNSTKYMTIPHPIDVAIPQTAKLLVRRILDE